VRQVADAVLKGVAIIGLVEGLAEATASILKLLSGWLVDRVGKGIRTAPRDALIASTTGQQIRGACLFYC